MFTSNEEYHTVHYQAIWLVVNRDGEVFCTCDSEQKCHLIIMWYNLVRGNQIKT